MSPTPLVVTLYLAALLFSCGAAVGIAVLLRMEGGRASAVALGGGGTFIALMTLTTAVLAPLFSR